MRTILVILGFHAGLFTDYPDSHEHAFIFFAGAAVLCLIKLIALLEVAITDTNPNKFWFHMGELTAAFFKWFFTKKKDKE